MNSGSLTGTETDLFRSTLLLDPFVCPQAERDGGAQGMESPLVISLPPSSLHFRDGHVFTLGMP